MLYYKTDYHSLTFLTFNCSVQFCLFFEHTISSQNLCEQVSILEYFCVHEEGLPFGLEGAEGSGLGWWASLGDVEIVSLQCRQE